MANGNSFLTFLAGAAVGAAVALLVKEDKEKIAKVLDDLEAKIAGKSEEQAGKETAEEPAKEA